MSDGDAMTHAEHWDFERNVSQLNNVGPPPQAFPYGRFARRNNWRALNLKFEKV